jgi:hypothetical protein
MDGRVSEKSAIRTVRKGGGPVDPARVPINEKQAGIQCRVIERLRNCHERFHAVLGFDGFIDDLCYVIDVRDGKGSGRRIATIAEFSRTVAAAAGLSCALDLKSRGIRPGGNAPNMGKAILEFGNDLSLIATLGTEEIHPLFRGVTDLCKNTISIGEPGYAEALEFLDGKLMFNRTGRLHTIGWETVCVHASPDRLKHIVGTASLIGFLDWTIFPLMEGLVEGFLGIIDTLINRPTAFFDPSDLRRRTRRDIIDIANGIGRCGQSIETILSLNESESLAAAEALSISEEAAAPRAAAIRDRLNIRAVVVHPLEGAAVATSSGSSWIDGPYTANPVISTGGGDTFNAGFCNGWMLKMAPEECAVLGAYTSGYYVRNGRPPGKSELIDLIETSGL